MSITLGPVARMMTKSLYSLLNSRHSWFETLCIIPEAHEELHSGMRVLQPTEGRISGGAHQPFG